MVEEVIGFRSKRSMLYATFYAKYQDMEDMATTTPGLMAAENPFNLDNIGDGFDVWTRGETQLLVLAVIVVILALIFAAIVAMDCGRNGPPMMRSGTLRDIVWNNANRRRRNDSQRNETGRSETGRSGTDNSFGDLKAPPLSYLAPPPYVDRRQDSSLPI
ncbi:uncharacterized protein CELE_K11D12.8 [Caenorhabditis elegans]|uniref:Uncharacterized protein n=1 Tax=Caenorhabditis elegans TaxID=6239 RepID=O44623_CAEEL|nr:Uncharacterized protein CELE_K11D12.8 [Caenorhabditis elegans]CCD64410.1 Uncharacterized protein CELE_K11D12.8 [Caenorhabditis elegans]|eukprot:NP_504353.2 Uncharacterized protein CELE_K11D12.8 [Caenorhabditis elegans]